MTKAVQQAKNLSHMLQPYYNNEERPQPKESWSKTTECEMMHSLSRLKNHPEFAEVNWSEYGTPNEFFLKAILEGDEDRLLIIYKFFADVVPAYNLPIFNQIINAESRHGARKVFVYLINLLSKSYDVGTTKAIRNLANQLLELFGFYTVLDAIIFLEESKKSIFNTAFQGISNKGVTVEFVLDWAKKFLEKRSKLIIDKREEWKDNLNQWVTNLPREQAAMVGMLVLSPSNKKKRERHLYNLKYEELKSGHIKELQNGCLKRRYIDLYLNCQLKYELDSLSKTEAELKELAKEKCAEWFKEMNQKVHNPESKDIELIDKQLEGNLKVKIKQIEFAFHKSLYDELLSIYFKFLKSQKIISEESNLMVYFNQLIPKWRMNYQDYFEKELERNTLPYDEDEYLKIKVLNWAKAHLIKSEQ